MENNLTKNCIFLIVKYGNWEIMETYSVIFHNYLISAFLRGKKRGKMIEEYPSPYNFNLIARNLNWETFSIFISQQSVRVFIPLLCYHYSACQRRAATPYFCYIVEIFLHRRRPAVPDARKRALRHSGTAQTEGGRTDDTATV